MTSTEKMNRIKDAQCRGHDDAHAEAGVEPVAAALALVGELPQVTVTEYNLLPERVKDRYCDGKEASSRILR